MPIFFLRSTKQTDTAQCSAGFEVSDGWIVLMSEIKMLIFIIVYDENVPT